MLTALSFLPVALALSVASGGADDVSISIAKKDADGFLVHTVRSPYQAGPTEIRVLLPDKLEPGKHYRVVYVLPVEAGRESRYGDGLREAKKLDLHNKLGVIFVQPTFAHLPWYGDHPTDARRRQETYFLKVVLPFVERTYPVQATAAGRLLLGFSKSGWGAFALLLRHPETFARAVAWDAPLAMDRPGRYGSDVVFPTPASFDGYALPKLLERRAKELAGEPRLGIVGYSNFRPDHEAVHALMTRLHIPHEYRDVRPGEHTWHSGWFADAARFLCP